MPDTCSPVSLPTPRRIVAIKQHCLLGGHREIGETTEELVKVNIIRPAHSPYNSPVWPIQKLNGTWCVTVDYRELNKVIAPLFAAVPNIASLLDQLSYELGTYPDVLDLTNAFLSVDMDPENQGQFAFTWEGCQCTFTVLLQGYLHSPTVCHGLVAEDLLAWTVPSSVRLYHYIDIMLTSNPLTESERAAPQLLAHLQG